MSLPTHCPFCSSAVIESIGSPDYDRHLTFACRSKWHGPPSGEGGFYNRACKVGAPPVGPVPSLMEIGDQIIARYADHSPDVLSAVQDAVDTLLEAYDRQTD